MCYVERGESVTLITGAVKRCNDARNRGGEWGGRRQDRRSQDRDPYLQHMRVLHWWAQK